MHEETANNKRVRVNVCITAKGQAQWDITAEFPTPEEAVGSLDKTIDMVRKTIATKGLTEVGATSVNG